MSPDAIKYVSVGIDADIDVGHNDLVFLRLLLVSEECVWHPHFGRVGKCEVVELA